MIVLDTNVVSEAMKPEPDGYIAAVAASRGFIVASRDTSPYEAAGVTVINPWKDE
jgi:predicted nucleic acid-binding protein